MEIPDTEMRHLGQSLTFLGPEAFRYYLPRFIQFSMAHPDSDAARYILYNLAPAADLDVSPRNRFAYFSPDELKALRKYIEYLADLEDPYMDKEAVEEALQFWVHDVQQSLGGP